MRAAYAFDRIMLCVLELSVLPTNYQKLQFWGKTEKSKILRKSEKILFFAKNDSS